MDGWMAHIWIMQDEETVWMDGLDRRQCRIARPTMEDHRMSEEDEETEQQKKKREIQIIPRNHKMTTCGGVESGKMGEGGLTGKEAPG